MTKTLFRSSCLDVFESVIFDWDGTLADTRQVVVDSFLKVLATVGVKVSGERIERLIGIGAANTFRQILQDAKVPFDDVLIRRLVEAKIQAEIDLSSKIKLFDGANELLEALNSKVKTALASMNNRKVINHLLATMNLKGFFDVVLTADEIRNSKPNPEIFLACASKLGSSPKNCVVVEDSVFGVKAAKSAEMNCIAVLTGVYTRSELKTANADLIVATLKDKEKILNFILR